MSTYDGPSGTGSPLAMDPERLISAAGGLDALASELYGTQVRLLTDPDLDAGNDAMNAALTEFRNRWCFGLRALVVSQQGRADNLRKAVGDLVGVDDVDGAYFRQILTEGFRP